MKSVGLANSLHTGYMAAAKSTTKLDLAAVRPPNCS